jgi:succinoglycan biosynthesis transport protein ExoP
MSDIIKNNGAPLPAVNSPQRRELAAFSPVSALSTQDILRKVWKRKVLILFVALLVIVPAVVITMLSTPLYLSSALLQVNPDPIQVLPYRDIADSGSGVYYEVYMSTQDQILRSPNLLSRVAVRLRSEPERSALVSEAPFLGQHFQVRRVPNSQLFQISYRASTPDAAARIVNLFGEEYVKQHLEARQATRERAKESLQKELVGLEQRLQLSEKDLLAYARREDMVNVGPEQGDLVQKRLTGLDQQIVDARSEVAVAQNRLETIQRASVKNFPERLTTPVLTSLTSKLLQAEQDLTNLRANFGENWPAVISKRDEIQLLQEQSTREKTLLLSRAVEQAQVDLRAAESKLRTASNAFGQQKDLVNRFNNALIEYNILRREVDTNRRLYDGLLERLSQTSLQEGFEFGNIQIVQPGRPNSQVDSPKVGFNLAWASLLGLTLGIGAAFLRDFWDDSMGSAEEAAEFTRLPVLGTVPSSRFLAVHRSNGLQLQAQSPNSLLEPLKISPAITTQAALSPPEVTEAIRAVCASLLLSQTDRPLRVVVVTSAVPAEGKTTVIGEIGRALAESGAKTLLVESDLRKSWLAESFGVDESDGLSLFLSGHRPSPRICETEYPDLFLAPAGPRPPNPVALLGSERMSTFLQSMASSFRFVLLDTPPILAVADARVLGAKADGLVLVTRARSTSKGLIRRAQAIMNDSGINVLGLVLNAVDRSDLHSMYYQRYYKAG